MSPLLEQFITEGRDFLQGIGEKLMALESDPDSVELMTELFRLVHTLKGNSGLFDFPEMTRVLHAGEDLMDSVRDGRVAYSAELADCLLDAMDFIGLLLDEIETSGTSGAGHGEQSNDLAQLLRALIPAREEVAEMAELALPAIAATPAHAAPPDLARIPEAARLAAWHQGAAGHALFWIAYRPDEECFFKGDDPFHQARQAPGLIWGESVARAPWPPLVELDCYRCQTDFHLLVATERAALDEYFRYLPEQVAMQAVAPLALVIPEGLPNGGPVYGDFVGEAQALLEADDLAGLTAAAQSLLELSSAQLWLSSDLRWLLAVLETSPERRDILRRLIEALNTLTLPDWSSIAAPVLAAETEATPVALPGNPALSAEDHTRLDAIFAAQSAILNLPDTADWLPGRLMAVATTLAACLANQDEATEEVNEVIEALAAALAERSARPLRNWLAAWREGAAPAPAADPAPLVVSTEAAESPATSPFAVASADSVPVPTVGRRALDDPASGSEPKFGRRAEDAQVAKVLKVDQAKVDQLMNLIGEMVVAKNSLPYLARRAEKRFNVPELGREIKAQYAVINRIAEEMQDAIMQVRMTPVSFVFQRFPRLVRDISRKLGKEVELVLEGEDTEADKNIIEALADPLVHIVRNSLDHGLELPEQRLAAGKPSLGRLLIRAAQESDRVLIEIIDDGRGIDPAVIKRKAYEKGVIDEATLERIGDQEAINLVFGAGFSTAEVVSDLSGRGVGMDVVRSAIDKVGGTVALTSTTGKGTTLRLSLPLSMAVSNVMIIESDRQIFGVPMDMVVETVRLPRANIHTIKRQQTIVLRGRIVPLVAFNDLLGVAAAPAANADDELAALVVRDGGEQVGLLVDDFREVVDVILKPLPGELARLTCYAGTALLGDGTVLMVLNPKELF
jgi:two-component system, chemotaxis family, sensor kinase CheA